MLSRVWYKGEFGEAGSAAGAAWERSTQQAVQPPSPETEE